MYGALTGEQHGLPFSLTIHGTRWGNLFRIPDSNVLPLDNPPEVDTPYVLPESVELTSSIDDRGGALSFEIVYRTGNLIEDPWTFRYPPLFSPPNIKARIETTLPDNALVEFRLLRTSAPANSPQSRLFIGFIESLEVRQNPGGFGTITTVHCVSTNVLLDRTIVRKAIAKNKRGQAAGRFTVRAGSDKYQIKQILKHVAAKKSVGDNLLFNARNYSQISKTVNKLPKLEVPVGTLREALESVMEAAQGYDGRKRNALIDPITGALQYGIIYTSRPAEYSEGYDQSYGMAPFRIVDTPVNERLMSNATSNAYQVMASLKPPIWYSLGGPDHFVKEHQYAKGAAEYQPFYRNRGAARGADIRRGDGVVPPHGPESLRVFGRGPAAVNWGVPAGDSALNQEFRAKHVMYATEGPRTLSVWLSVGVELHLGGAAGIEIISTNDSPSDLSLSFDGTTYDLSARPKSAGEDTQVVDHVVFRYEPDSENVLIVVNGEEMVDTTQAVPASAPTAIMEVEGIGGSYTPSGVFGLMGWWNRALTLSEIELLWTSGNAEQMTNAIIPRDFTVSVDHSRVTKTALLLAADSKADRDKDPDPYVRRYDQAGVVANIEAVNMRRPGIRFEALVDAATIRSGTPAQRSAKISKLAKAYFQVRSAPEIGGRFSIRGAGTGAGQELGFAGGWAELSPEEQAVVPAGTRTENAPYSTTSYRTWRAGQLVYVQTSLLTGTYLITSVTMGFEPGSFIRRFDVDFGTTPKRSIAQLLIAE
jgi:hypothetical protein